MKKRKPPILPVTLLLVLLSIVAYTNYQNSPLTQKERASQAPKLAEARPTEDKKAVSDRLKASVATDEVKAPMVAGENPLAPVTGPGEMPPQAKAQMEKMKKVKGVKDNMGDPTMQKPIPNDSATSTQWYRPDARK